jgi:hypothetical protein
VRLICELFLAALLIWLGWEKSFHSWTNQWRGIPDTAATSSAQVQPSPGSATANVPAQNLARRPYVDFPARAAAANTPSGDWMWDPGHHGALDAPATKAGAAVNPTAPPTASYWIDGNGVRHYYNPQSAPPPPSHSP